MGRITSPLEGEVETAGNRPGVEGGGYVGFTPRPYWFGASMKSAIASTASAQFCFVVRPDFLRGSKE